MSNIEACRRIAAGLLAWAIAPLIGRGLVMVAGNGVDTAWLHAASFGAFVLAGLAFLVGELLRAGHSIEQDRDGFV